MKFIVLLFPLLVGCMQIGMLPYMDQALTLQDFSKEKDEQVKYVANADATFDRLWAAVQSGDIKKYKSEPEIVAAFGLPVLVKIMSSDGKNFHRSLYRYAVQSKGPHKVYFYYENGVISRVEII